MDNYIVGKNSVLAALKNKAALNKIWLAEGQKPGFVKEIIDLARSCNVPYQMIDRESLKQKAGENHRGVVAEAAPYDYVAIENILARAKKENANPLVLILAEIQDPHNLGAIMRTAECAGVHGIIIPKHRSVAVNQTVLKVAEGAAAFMPVARVTNLNQAVEKLKAAGLWVAGADMAGKENLWQANLKGPLALVMGSEGEGIPKLLKKNCDFLINIPLWGNISSLNVSVATGVLLYEIKRQGREQ